MHKEKYILADMQIIEFENEDVITTSAETPVPDEEDPTTEPSTTQPITEPLDDDEGEIMI